MAFTKIAAAGIGSTETVTIDGLSVINDGSFGGNVTIGGTLTYEDVTNIDSVGLITARAGVNVGSGITLSKDGDIFATGVTTSTTFSGSGANLTNLPAANITGTLPAISGANLTNLDASDLASGTIPDARFPATLPAVSGANLTGIAATDNVRTGILDVAGIATFRDNANVIRINDTQVGGYRNMITNGDCIVSQRFIDASNTGYVGTVDMFRTSTPGGMSATKQRVADAPAGTGLYYSLKITNGGSTYSVPSNSTTIYHQLNSLEGYKTRMLEWGTSAAKPVTLSFYVKSSQTGTFAVAIGNATGDQYHTGTSRTFIRSYTVSSANTWERKTLTFDGDTSGTWVGIGTGGSLSVIWDLGSGGNYQGASTDSWQSSSNFRFSGAKSLGDAANATWQITGVQLEVGRQATDFEHKDYKDVLDECTRHFQTWYYNDGKGTQTYVDNDTGGLDSNSATFMGVGVAYDSDDIHVSEALSPHMRSKPAVVEYTGMICVSGGSAIDDSTYVQENRCSRDRLNLHIDNQGGLTEGYAAALILKNSSSKFSISCEI